MTRRATGPARIPRSWRFRLAALLVACGLAARHAAAATLLLAQEEQGGVRTRQGGGKNYVLEAVVVAALFGLALYSICRSSRRA